MFLRLGVSLGHNGFEEIHSLVFSGSNTAPRHNIKWQEFLVGKGLAESFQGAKEED